MCITKCDDYYKVQQNMEVHSKLATTISVSFLIL